MLSHGACLTQRLELEAGVLSARAGEADPGQLLLVPQGPAVLRLGPGAASRQPREPPPRSRRSPGRCRPGSAPQVTPETLAACNVTTVDSVLYNAMIAPYVVGPMALVGWCPRARRKP